MSETNYCGLALERRLISRSTASRMNSARLFGPAISSMRSACSSVRRTRTGLVADLVLSGGRPMRPVVADIGKFVKPSSKAISLIDVVTDIAYLGNTEALEDAMPKIIDTRKTPLVFNDAARPFAVLSGSTVKGRYATEAQAKRRARDLTPRVGVVPLERNPFYDNVQWVRS